MYFFIKYLFSGSTLDIGDKAVNRKLSFVIRIFSFGWRETDSKQINTVQCDKSENKSIYKEEKRIKKRILFQGQSVKSIF